MLRTFLTVSLLFLGTLAAHAQSCGTRDLISELSATQRQELDKLVAAHPFPDGIMFDATKSDSKVTVVGTIHVPDPRLAPIVDRVRDDLAKADVVILEATTEDQANLQALATTRPEVFFLTEGPTLIDLLTEEEWAAVTERLKALGLPSFFAAKFKPWYLSLTLAIPPCILSDILSGAKGLDAQLEGIAKSENVPIATLDDIESLIEIMAGDPLDVQLDALRLALQMQSDSDAMTSTLIERYFKGKIRETWEFGRIVIAESGMPNAKELFDEMNDVLLVGRNRAWEPKIAQLVDGKDAVLAVGAAHLSGEDGVLRALERAGYTITSR
ncbi:MAG: TraB/GumN family protein [Paracoccaceae bacterium]|nr:TraB/GumN family protein [Paracoccaceae bacterium]